jgi:hypothetical protein
MTTAKRQPPRVNPGSDRRRMRILRMRKNLNDGERESLEGKRRHGVLPLSETERVRLNLLTSPPKRGAGKPGMLEEFHRQIAVAYLWTRNRPDAPKAAKVAAYAVARAWGGVTVDAVRKYTRLHRASATSAVNVYLASVAANPESASAVDATLEYWARAFKKLGE